MRKIKRNFQFSIFNFQINRGLPRTNALATRGRSPREKVSSVRGFTLIRTRLHRNLAASAVRTRLHRNLAASAVRTRLHRNLDNVHGFTLIEILLVIGMLGVLMTVLIVAVNPGRQLAKARDTKREADMVAILSAILQYSSEHSGALPDTDGDPETSNFPTSLTCIGTGGSCFDLAGAGDTGEEITPVYLVTMPLDPQTGSAADTEYLIMVDTNGHLTASASGETKTVSLTR